MGMMIGVMTVCIFGVVLLLIGIILMWNKCAIAAEKRR